MIPNLDVTKLPDLVQKAQKGVPFMSKAILKLETVALIQAYSNFITDLKSKQAVESLDHSIVLQDGNIDGLSDGLNTVAVEPFYLDPTAFKTTTPHSVRQLERTWHQKALTAGQHYDTIAYAGEITENFVANVGKIIEKLLWQGDVESAVANLAWFDGFIKQIKANGTDISAEATGTNLLKRVQKAYRSIKNDELTQAPDFRIVMSKGAYSEMLGDQYDQNQFHLTAEKYVPGTDLRIEFAPGLDGTGFMSLGRMQDLHAGTDLLGDIQFVKTEYDNIHEKIYQIIRFNLAATHSKVDPTYFIQF